MTDPPSEAAPGIPGAVPSSSDPIPISLVAHYVFCPRRAWLEAMGEATDTQQMTVGTVVHSASDNPAAARAGRLRAVEVASARLGVIGRCDQVDVDESGSATVVEYKATPVRRRAEVTEPMAVQLALQAEALREQGMPVTGAAVYFTEHQQRVAVPLTAACIEAAAGYVDATARMLGSTTAPEPLEDDRRCTRCSHAGVCLPDERALAPIRRRVLVVDPDAHVVHLSTPGARASIRSGRMRVDKGSESIGSVPIELVLAVVAHGNIDLSTGLIRELLWRRIPIIWCSGTGRVIGWAASAHSPNGGPRVRQHVASDSGHLPLAREFLVAKICNQATLLRRHGDARDAVRALRHLQRQAAVANSIAELYGIEGDAAARYFAAFPTMLTPRVTDPGLRQSRVS